MKRYSLLLLVAAAILIAVAIVFWSGGTHKDEPTDQAAEPASDYAEQMREQHAQDEPIASPAAAAAPAAATTHETVSYGAVNGKSFDGYLARPADTQGPPPPALVIYHEWWGLNDNIKAMADQLAAQGYLVLAADFYDGQVYDTPEGARDAMNAALDDKARLAANIYAAYDYLKAQGVPGIGALGWCFGGSMAFQNALLTPKGLDATVIYYGHVGGTAEQLRPIESPILAFFGARDESIPVEAVQQFRERLQSLGKSVEIHVYDDAGHAFANPSGKNYVEDAAEDAWQRTLAFLAEHLQSGDSPAAAESAPK